MAVWSGGAAPADAAPPVEELIQQAFGADAPLMLRVARCESRLDPSARNPRSSARGVFQLVSHWGTEAERLDAATNIRTAKWLFDRWGTQPWRASERCWGDAASIAPWSAARPFAPPLVQPSVWPSQELGRLRLVG